MGLSQKMARKTKWYEKQFAFEYQSMRNTAVFGGVIRLSLSVVVLKREKLILIMTLFLGMRLS
jgi:hypothetical protein